ncbi:MAG TPA: methyltransferase domain-containing protein [Thermoanaerobaculia bacterium]|nr:methyltransferase domain-containing protein [Thermoanaerobaculia bacterium]
MVRLRFVMLLPFALLVGFCGGSPSASEETTPSRFSSVEELEEAALGKDVPYVPTAQPTVDEMLRMARVSSNDVVYDLGSGDGRIVITAAAVYGARGVGIEIDPKRIREAEQNARAAGVSERVEFIRRDLFTADLTEATAVTLYLLPEVNVRLRPRLLEQLRPGTPVVSHDFSMGDWEADERRVVGADIIYLWIVPAKVEGRWSWTGPDGRPRSANLEQRYQALSGSAESGGRPLAVRGGRLDGPRIAFELATGRSSAAELVERYGGTVEGDRIRGWMEPAGGSRSEWVAQRGE